MTRRKQQDFDIVVSSENNDYLAWQCLVFHHSCVTHLGLVPIFVVHGDDGPLVAGYRILQEKGGIIQRLPTRRHAGSVEYPCRNAWASLSGVKTAADNIVLCDPDVIFLRRIDFAGIAAGLKGEAVSLDRVGYMTAGDQNRVMLEEVCKTSWIDTKLLDGIKISGGMPYIIPTGLRRRLAREWAVLTDDCLMMNLKRHGQMNSEVWISIMWGFVLAALRSDIPMTYTDLCVTNGKTAKDQDLSLSDCKIVHYCYGDEVFNKRNYMSEEGSLKTVWKATAPEGTVNGAVTQAIQEAAGFFELA